MYILCDMTNILFDHSRRTYFANNSRNKQNMNILFNDFGRSGMLSKSQAEISYLEYD